MRGRECEQYQVDNNPQLKLNIQLMKHLRGIFPGVAFHWVVWNMPETATEIAEGEEPEGVHGRGTRGGLEYQGPCPPDARHTYFFKLYALDAKLSLKEGATKLDLEQAMAGHILSQSELTGTYERKR